MSKCKKCCKGRCLPCLARCVQPDPCRVPPPQPFKCLRYFACNLDKICPCECCDDESDSECPPVRCKRCCMSWIERRLEPCRCCGNDPAHPCYVQKKHKVMEAEPKDEKAKGKQKKKKKKKKGRRSGGGIGSEDNCLITGQDIFGDNSLPSDDGASDDASSHNCAESASCSDLTRAIRQLRLLLAKYNIEI